MSRTYSKETRCLAKKVAALKPGSNEGAFEAAVEQVLNANGYRRFPERDQMFNDIASLSHLWMQAHVNKEQRIKFFNELQPSLFA